MSKIFLGTILFFVTSAMAAPLGRSAASSQDEQKKIRETLRELRQKIEDKNQDKSCKKSEDCVSVAAGERLCGGPAEYLIVSTQNSHFEEIKSLAQQHVKLSGEYNKKYSGGSMGICSVLTPTTLVCRQKQCAEEPI